MRRLAAIGLLGAAVAGCATRSAPRAAGVRDAVAALRGAVHDLGGRVGIVVVDAEDGAVLAAHDADQGFLPASNQKVLTAAVALATLGPDATMATELLHTGAVREGVLSGDLILRGFGDPTLGTDASGDPDLARFVGAVRAAGIRRVEGRVLGDDAWLGKEHLGRGWQWDHLREAFAAPFGGLCCRGNVAPAADAAPPVPVADPAVFAATCLTAALRAAGIEVVDATVAAGDHERLLHRTESPPLPVLLHRMLAESDNLYAEQLWRVAARTATGDGGTDAAASHATAVLARLGVDTRGLEMVDGSGLSRRNLARPRHLASTLLAMARSPWRDAFVTALPIAGESGTLRDRFGAGPARGRVRAKTGSIARVVALSGYVPRGAAPPWVFAVLWNDFTGGDDAPKAAVDAFVQALAAPPTAAR